MWLHCIFGAAHVREEYLVDNFLLRGFIFAVKFSECVLYGGCLYLAATNVEKEVFIDGLAGSGLESVEATSQAAGLVGTLASGGAFRVLSALRELSWLGDS